MIMNITFNSYEELVSKIQQILIERKATSLLLPFETEYDLAIMIANELIK